MSESSNDVEWGVSLYDGVDETEGNEEEDALKETWEGT